MTTAEAAAFGWDAVVPLVRWVLYVACALLGFALLKEISG